MGGGGKAEKARRSPARVRLWVARASTVLLWTCVLHLAAYRELWAPGLLTRWPGCLTEHPSKAVAVAVAVADGGQREAVRTALPPKSKLLVCWFSVSEIFVDQASLLSLVRNFWTFSFVPISFEHLFSFLIGGKRFYSQLPRKQNNNFEFLSFPSFYVCIWYVDMLGLFPVQFNHVLVLSSHQSVFHAFPWIHQWTISGICWLIVAGLVVWFVLYYVQESTRTMATWWSPAMVGLTRCVQL